MSTTKTRVLLCGKQGGVRRLCFLENATRTRFVRRSLYIMSGVILGIYILRHCSLHVWSLNRFFPRQHTNSYDVARTLPLSMKNYKYVLPAHLWRALRGEDEDVFTKTSGQCGCFFFIFTWLKTAWFTFWMLFAPRAAFSGRICSL